MPSGVKRIGLISDTHGLLRKEAVEALRGSELILHAGDVGKPEILEELRKIAPVVAVRGNVGYGGGGSYPNLAVTGSTFAHGSASTLPHTATTGAIFFNASKISGLPTSPAWRISSDPRRASTASSRSKP